MLNLFLIQRRKCKMTKEEVTYRYNEILEELEELEQELHQLAENLNEDDAKTDSLWWDIIDTEKHVKQAITRI